GAGRRRGPHRVRGRGPRAEAPAGRCRRRPLPPRRGAAPRGRAGARGSERRQAVLLLVPCALVLLVLFALPHALLFEAPLRRRSAYGGVVHEWSALNYTRALTPLYLAILVRSVGLALATTVLCLLLAYPAAFWLGLRVPPRWRSALLVLVILPFWTSFLV